MEEMQGSQVERLESTSRRKRVMVYVHYRGKSCHALRTRGRRQGDRRVGDVVDQNFRREVTVDRSCDCAHQTSQDNTMQRQRFRAMIKTRMKIRGRKGSHTPDL